jgi:prepilin-type N-terminal cleavage/methylation domain-containing protein
MPAQIAHLSLAKPQRKRLQGFTLNGFTLSGFTLVELLVVITLLGLLALTATVLVENVGEQDRFDTTRARWQQIRTAIVGDTTRTLNGEPALTGYVADMGRLPKNLKELVELGTQPAWGKVDLSLVTTVSPATANLYGGWRGPYLPATPETGGSRTYRDGWDNPLTPAEDYGWKLTLTGTAPDHTAIAVQSLGSDGIVTTVTGAGYAEDYPASGNLVSANDWQLGSASFNVVFNKAPSVDSPTLKLRIYYIKASDTDSSLANSVQAKDSTTDFAILSTDTAPYAKTTSISSFTPSMGRYIAIVFCASSGEVYDGNCDGVLQGTSVHAPYYFTLIPSSTLPITIPWSIP